MISFIGKIIRAIFWIFILLVAMPTFLFLIKNYYANLITKKTYIGIIKLPVYIENSDAIIDSARVLFRAPQIKAVVLKIDGQGGNAGACQAVYYDLVNLKSSYQKPLIAYCESECSAGAYFLGTAADVIIMNPATLINKLGVFSLHPEAGGAWNKEKLVDYWDVVKDARKHFISPSNDIMPVDIIGRQAYESHLIDYLGGSTEIERVLRLKTVIEGRIEEVHGSLIEHFTLSLTNAVGHMVKTIRQAWMSAN